MSFTRLAIQEIVKHVAELIPEDAVQILTDLFKGSVNGGGLITFEIDDEN